MTIRFAACGVVLLIAACAPPAPAPCPEPPPVAATTAPTAPPAPAEPRAVAIVRALLGPDARATYDGFSPGFRAAVPFDKIAASTTAATTKLGTLVELRLAQVDDDANRSTSTVIAFRERGSDVFTVTLDASGVLIGLRKKDLVDRPDADETGPADGYVAKRLYALPGKGAWYVANGGRDPAKNHHVGNEQQWYAFDIDKRDDKGNEARGDGKRNEDHYVFGEPVLAPAPGTIVLVIDAVDDYPPGERERYVTTGNTVIIDHGEDEFSVLAHFKKGSIVVKGGQKVKVGQVIGKVGNTGNSSDPHAHWHLATQGGLSRGHGLPIRFAPLLVNGKRVENATPVRGDVIENAP